MLRIHKADQEVIREKIREGRIEGAVLGRAAIPNSKLFYR
jgi:hypothetical protein